MEIATKRFLLRDFSATDRAAFVVYQCDPRYVAVRGPEHPAPGHAHHLLKTFGQWAADEPRCNYQLAIVRRSDRCSLVGCAGLRRKGWPDEVAELGIELAPDFWGRHGYAMEVARALLEFGFDVLRLRAIRGRTTSANARVARLATWFGAELIAIRPGPDGAQAEGCCATEWELSRRRWEKRRRDGGLPACLDV